MIPAHTTPQPQFSVANKYAPFPALSTLAKMSPDDQQALNAWWQSVQQVLQRQFLQVTGEISSNSTDIATLEGTELTPSTAPSGVTVGTTPVDQWFTTVSEGVTYYLPGWKAH
jgi:hypothetical protein